jgi:hypothetical protein
MSKDMGLTSSLFVTGICPVRKRSDKILFGIEGIINIAWLEREF